MRFAIHNGGQKAMTIMMEPICWPEYEVPARGKATFQMEDGCPEIEVRGEDYLAVWLTGSEDAQVKIEGPRA